MFSAVKVNNTKRRNSTWEGDGSVSEEERETTDAYPTGKNEECARGKMRSRARNDHVKCDIISEAALREISRRSRFGALGTKLSR